jgi:hypothetical protein
MSAVAEAYIAADGVEAVVEAKTQPEEQLRTVEQEAYDHHPFQLTYVEGPLYSYLELILQLT